GALGVVGLGNGSVALGREAGEERGRGPAVSTGKLSTKCCPGGIRSDSSDPDRRPVKPRMTIADFLRRRVKGASRTTRYSAPFTQIPREVWCAVRGAVMPDPLYACTTPKASRLA